MLILDTNVLSELMRPRPEPAVLDWCRARPLSDMATTAVTLAEIQRGLARLPIGRRRRDLEVTLNGLMAHGFAKRIFDFDAAAAEVYGDLVVARERVGRRLAGFDGLVLAIAKSRGCPIATRNTTNFEGCGVPLMNPWVADPS